MGRDKSHGKISSRSANFNPRAPCGARPSCTTRIYSTAAFQSTRPVWGATSRHFTLAAFTADFNPRAPCGARRRTVAVADRLVRFQSTRPVWGATHGRDRRVEQLQISIHAPRVGRDGRPFGRWTGADISIHAPRVGRDRGRRGTAGVVPDFNPRAPCGARRCRHDAAICVNLISIHAPRVGRDKILVVQPPALKISIHAPRVGRDPIQVCPSQVYLISIHAPRVGRDVDIAIDDALDRISIHAPRVGRDPSTNVCVSAFTQFQSTRPVWGATAGVSFPYPTHQISIHAPRVGRDTDGGDEVLFQRHFNPRAPCGARPTTKG